MRKIKHLFTALMLLCSVAVNAHDFEVDGIYYNITDEANKTVYVTSGVKYTGGVVIPNSVTYNGNTYSVTSIGDEAFYNCSGLTSIEIPNSVTSIGNNAFYNCSGLTSIIVKEGNTVYDSRNNCNAIIETSSNTLLNGCKNTVIPNSVTSIENEAFSNCSGLTSIEIPNSVTSIGSFAFEGCTGLTSITIGNSVTSIGNYAFYNCSGLTSITIPNSVTSIGEYMFSDCTGLTSITIPNSVTSIGEDAFYRCSGLKEVHITDLSAWCNIDFEDDDSNPLSYADNLYLNDELITELVVPDGITKINNYAFSGCSGLTSITIPNSVTSIEWGAFYGCSLKKIELNCKEPPRCFDYNNSIKEVIIGNSVTSIGNYVFQTYSALESIVVDPGNAKYDSRENCNAIIETERNTLVVGCKNSVIPNSVTSIGSSAFSSCSGLTSITIPNSVTSIGSAAFYYCSGLTSITIPNSVTYIGMTAFSGCSGLTSITIPNSVTYIGENAFTYCSGLKEVHITDLEAWKNISFGYKANPLNNSNAKLYLNGVEVKQ